MHNKMGDGETEYDETICDMLAELPIMKKRKAASASGEGECRDGGSVSSSLGNN
jgi:hypothetical protein